MKRWLYPLLWILLGTGLSAAFFLISSPPRGTAVQLLPPPTPAPVIVDVHGAVHNPGVYALPQNCRVKDAIDAAGGMTAETDRDAVNLAAKLKDGDKLTVPAIGSPEVEAEQKLPSPIQPESEAVERTTGLDAASPTGGFVNINTATAEALTQLPGIGPATADKIVAYRESHGLFQNIEEIMDVPGIGSGKFEAMKDQITVE
jgi:competence protein ComEA